MGGAETLVPKLQNKRLVKLPKIYKNTLKTMPKALHQQPVVGSTLLVSGESGFHDRGEGSDFRFTKAYKFIRVNQDFRLSASC